jgi:nucleotide-binding universal stress UspA family protein
MELLAGNVRGLRRRRCKGEADAYSLRSPRLPSCLPVSVVGGLRNLPRRMRGIPRGGAGPARLSPSMSSTRLWHAFGVCIVTKGPVTITHILVPTDFSADANAAFTYAQELARKYDAPVHVLHVVEDPLAAGAWSSDVYTAQIAGLQINLVRDAEQRLRRSVPDDGGAVSIEVRTGNAAKQIVEAARETGADLIVMGTRGRTGVAHAIMGSVAERVVRLAPCPVLTLRAEAVTT